LIIENRSAGAMLIKALWVFWIGRISGSEYLNEGYGTKRKIPEILINEKIDSTGSDFPSDSGQKQSMAPDVARILVLE
jgi:hypothetical protein